MTAASVTFAISAASPASVKARAAVASVAANSLHVAAALEIALGGGVGFSPARKRRRREQLRVGCACLRERAIGFDEQRRTQILLGRRLCGKRGEQAGEYDEPSESH